MTDTATEAGRRAGEPARRDRPGAPSPAGRVARLRDDRAAGRHGGGPAGPCAEGASLRLLEAAPNPYLLLRPDAPRFTILGASGAYLAATSTRRGEIVGRAVFEVFPDNPGDPAASGVRNLRASLGRVLASRAPDRMPVQKYDIRRPDGAFEERHWSPLNTPVLGPGGGVEAIIHHVEDVTESARLRARSEAVEARQSFLLRLGDALRPLHDPEEMQAEACRLLGGHLGAAQVGFGRIDAAQERVAVRRDWNDGRLPSVVGTWRMDDFGPAFAAAMRRGETVAIPDIAEDPKTGAPDVAAAYAGIGTRAILDLPLVKGGRMVAMLFIHHPEPRPWSAAEVEVAGETCERLWDAAERARAEEALRESEGRLRATQDNAGVGIVEIDDRGRYARVNGTYTRLSGWTAADLAGRAYWDLIEDDGDRRDARRDHGRLVRGEVDRLAAQREYTGGDGRRWWAEITATAIRGAPDAAHPGGRFLYAVRTVQDVTERKRAEERRALLVNELNHRVKNTLAVVQSLALQTARGAADLPAFSAAFQARLVALARAHDLLTRESWEGAPLAEVARAALAPNIAGAAAARVDLDACASGALLEPQQALALALALHELATNALKHGALSVPGGRVSLACRPDPGDGAHVVEWLERGGPPIPRPPARKGFGLRLLQRGLRAQAGVAADLRFEPAGVRCTLRLPPPAIGSRPGCA